jgi:nucleotide-binding universal stress UspA family protein
MKNLLIHIVDASDFETRVELAFDLAERLGAHLVGLHTLTPPSMPEPVIGRGASAVLLAERTERNRKLSADLEARFREASRRRGLPCEWRAEEGEPAAVLALHSRYADLVIATLPQRATFEEFLIGPPIDRLALVVACPVLFVPTAFVQRQTAHRVVVGWKSGRSCARALRDSMPVLRLADEVTIITIRDVDADHLHGAEIATSLARHGVKATVRQDFDSRGGDAGAELLAHAATMNADLVVMGAYGHSRLRELVLGGATQKALNDARIPLLMSH